MTINQTLKAIKALGLTARYNPEYQEYRINIPGGKEATAYYTNDSEDAIKTAESMRPSSIVGNCMANVLY
jgi:hypothetical protein